MTFQNTSHYFTPQKPLNERGKIRVFTWDEREIQFDSGKGVFAKSGLDTGSRLLLRTALPHLAALPAGACIGDLGCGWGAVGCVLAGELPQHRIMMSDINPRAVELAHYNAQLNHLSNTHIWCDDSLASIQSPIFHAILCNPPIRAGNVIIKKIFESAHRGLLQDGDLYVVIRTAQGAKSWIKRLKVLFSNSETLEVKSGYRILHCIR